jgi:hypothetical protein
MTEFDFKKCDVLVLRANIEFEMLSVIIGRGGAQELGRTFWGQTELACYDDTQHGIWGMSYKYHECVIVTNEWNLIHLFDVVFDGYVRLFYQHNPVYERSLDPSTLEFSLSFYRHTGIYTLSMCVQGFSRGARTFDETFTYDEKTNEYSL